jgi:trk system potassium uptake protein TrkH
MFQDFRIILKALGALWVLLSVAMCIPLAVGLYYADEGVAPIAYSACATLVTGILFFFVFQKTDEKHKFKKRSAFLFVTITWVGATVFGCLPYIFSGVCPSWIDAWFEAASGFTTTGATVISGLDSVPRSILLWRSLSQFLGGMGIIVLSLAVLPILGVGGMDVYRAEAPGPTSDKISSRVGETARALWIVYLLFALVQTLLLWFFGMSPFDAINHALTTMATGGFSTHDSSVGGFDSPAIDAIITIFMFFAGINFLLHYRLLIRGEFAMLRDRECRFYFIITLLAMIMVSLSLWYTTYPSLLTAIRYGTFQVSSILSSTGYGSADYLQWGLFSQAILLSLMVIGGCAGSTAGGIKCVRAMMLVKQGYRELNLMIHPKAVMPLKVGKNTVPAQVASSIFGFFFLYVLLVAVAGLAVTSSGVDLLTAYSGVVSALSNIGPGFGEIGPALNYAGLPDLAKIILAICMIVGRLEIMTVLVLFTRGFWSH